MASAATFSLEFCLQERFKEGKGMQQGLWQHGIENMHLKCEVRDR